MRERSHLNEFCLRRIFEKRTVLETEAVCKSFCLDLVSSHHAFKTTEDHTNVAHHALCAAALSPTRNWMVRKGANSGGC